MFKLKKLPKEIHDTLHILLRLDFDVKIQIFRRQSSFNMSEKEIDKETQSKPSNSVEQSEASGKSIVNVEPNPIAGGPVRFEILPGVAASPPQFVSMDEIMSAANGVINMHLAHEIVFDQEFRLKKHVPQNSIEKVVTETVHKAFWDILLDELNDSPPQYKQAMHLLEDVKNDLLGLLLPYNTKLKQEINEMLDIPLIKQQAENNALDFLGYAHYVLGVMGRMCAPVRDDDICELKKATDIVEIFKGIFEVLTQMKLDFANFNIQMFRPEILAHSVEYEKTNFAEFVRVNGGVDNLIRTKKWLRKYVEKTLTEKSNCTPADVLPSAYIEILEWSQEDALPETVIMDSSRLQSLSNRLYQLIITGSILLVTLSNLKSSVLQGSQAFKDTLIKEIGIVLHDAKDDIALKALLPNLSLQVFEVVRKFMNSSGAAQSVVMDPSIEKTLAEAIQDLERPIHPVRRLVGIRVKEFLQLTLASLPNITHQVPSGLTTLKQDLLSLTANVVRLYEYNQAVFGEYYSQIISKLNEEICVERSHAEI